MSGKAFVLLRGERGEGGTPLGVHETLIQAMRASGIAAATWVKNPPERLTNLNDCWLATPDNDVDQWWIVRFTR